MINTRLVVGDEYIVNGRDVFDKYKNERVYLVSYRFDDSGESDCFIRFENVEKFGNGEYYCRAKDLNSPKILGVELDGLI